MFVFRPEIIASAPVIGKEIVFRTMGHDRDERFVSVGYACRQLTIACTSRQSFVFARKHDYGDILKHSSIELH